MEKAVALRIEKEHRERWILDGAMLREALKDLDQVVALEPYDPRPNREARINMTIVWPRGEGIPWNSVPDDALDFILNPATGIIAYRNISLQWPMPEGFADAILAAARDITPTPRAEATVQPGERPNGGTYLDHPDDELTWDGPDDRMKSFSRDNEHCGPPGALVYLYGIPGGFLFGDDFDTDPFFNYGGAVEPSDSWRWTGYYHGGWQIWQGDDPWSVYLVHADEERFAFEYRTYYCI